MNLPITSHRYTERKYVVLLFLLAEKRFSFCIGSLLRHRKNVAVLRNRQNIIISMGMNDHFTSEFK